MPPSNVVPSLFLSSLLKISKLPARCTICHFNRKIRSLKWEFLHLLYSSCYLRLSLPPLFWSLPAFRLPPAHVLHLFSSCPRIWLPCSCFSLSLSSGSSSAFHCLSFLLWLLNLLKVWLSPFPACFSVLVSQSCVVCLPP